MAGRTCVFCGGTPVTNEHVYRQEMANILKDLGGEYTWVDYHSGRTRALPAGVTPFTEATVKRMCAPCNNGWMNAIDLRAEPVLRDLVNGVSRSVTKNEATRIASWAAKTCMARSYMEPIRSITDNDLSRMFHQHKAPPDWRVYVGRIPNVGLTSRFDYSVGGLEPYPPGSATFTDATISLAQLTLALGPFVVTVIGVDGSNAAIQYTHRSIQYISSKQELGLTQIWPLPQAFDFTEDDSQLPLSRFGPITEYVQLIQKTNRAQRNRMGTTDV